MGERVTTNRLRTLAQFSSGTDLVVRMQEAEQVIVWQREGLTWAADEIDRLTAELEAARAPAPACTVNADGHDSGTTRAP